MDGWYISLAGAACDLRAAAFCLDWPEATVFQSEKIEVCLRSTDFVGLSMPEAVTAHSSELLRLVNGAMRAAADNYRPIHAWSVHRDGWVGYGICSASRDLWSRQRELDDRATSDIWERGSARCQLARAVFAAARRRPEVARALDLWMADRHGVTVYKIFEIIRAALGERLGEFTSRAMLTRFTGSVNRPEVLGDYSRHEVQPGAPPRQPMSREEVEQYVQDLLCRWACAADSDV